MNPIQFLAKGAAMGVLIAFAAWSLLPTHPASQAAGTGRLFAEKLVATARESHPQVTRIGIAVGSTRACRRLASSDPADVRAKCEKEEILPIETGRSYVEREAAGFDIALPLHDRTGRLVGSLSIELKSQPGQSGASALASARELAKGIERQIPSRAILWERSR